jgi:DNA mismatch repair protein MutL
VDVNIHPTKAEVKFREPERIFHAVTETLRSIDEKEASSTEIISGEVHGKSPYGEAFQESLLSVTEGPLGRLASAVREEGRGEWRVEAKSPFRVIGQAQGTYIVCEGEGGLIFIDQHAAHERILFNQYRNQYETKSIVPEKFLMPISMELSAEESIILESHLEELKSMGLEIDPIGERIFAIRSKPSWMDQKDPKVIIKEILDELSFLKREGKGTETVDTILITVACHSAIRANFTLRREEMEELVKTLSPFNLSTTCPHGRPIFFLLRLDELAKQFKRK